MLRLVQCWMEHPVRSVDQVFTYLCEFPVKKGARVEVDFNGRILIGFVETVTETEEPLEVIQSRLGVTLKPVYRVLDEESLITEELHQLAMFMRETTVSTAIACFQTMLPAKVKPRSGTKKAVMERWVKLGEELTSLTPKQLECYLYVRDHGPLRYSEVRKKFPSQARDLVKNRSFICFEKEREGTRIASEVIDERPVLTPQQTGAIQKIHEYDDEIFLIHGVTGSGKTEVYLRLAEEVLRQGKQVLFLVPEIGLTPQMISRVSSRFGDELAIYHSGLNDQEKYEQYRSVKNGRARIVVGTRSAVFLPFDSLGLIVMDEEHDTSYKQDNQPSYHCRDIAAWRASYHHCRLILGSATPSLESYSRALKDVYHLIRMDRRVNDTLPAVTVVPLKETMKKGESYILSDVLKDKIALRLEKKEQVILLLNRRGYHTMLRCRSCREPIVCPHCDLAMSYHRQEKVMKCHTCGETMRVPAACPSCGSRLGFTTFGFGTEKLEEELNRCFPDAALLRMDADTTSRKNMHRTILEKFGRHEADILIGTQMIAKGLDYPDVTLVGVVNGDEGLARTDFRSCELTFDLLMQAGGRSGRGNKTGEVVFQVFDPDHYAVQAAVRQDYEMFFRYEMQYRHAGMYPPYTYIISLTVNGTDQKKVNDTASFLKNQLHGGFSVIGVVSLPRIRDRARARVLLKGKNLDEMRAVVRKALAECGKGKDIRVNVNPMGVDG